MNDKIDRVRRVDVNNLSEQQVDELSDLIGTKVRDIVDEACDRINTILGIYGLQAKIQFVIQEKETLE